MLCISLVYQALFLSDKSKLNQNRLSNEGDPALFVILFVILQLILHNIRIGNADFGILWTGNSKHPPSPVRLFYSRMKIGQEMWDLEAMYALLGTTSADKLPCINLMEQNF